MNFLQRLAAPTPAQEKRIQVICLFLEGVDAWLHNLGYLPTMVAVIIGSVLAGAAMVAQYAVELVPEILSTVEDPTLPKIMTTLDDLGSKFGEVKDAISNFSIPDPTEALLKAINDASAKTDAPPAAQPTEQNAVADNSTQAKINAAIGG